jgi:hypothetical protein
VANTKLDKPSAFDRVPPAKLESGPAREKADRTGGVFGAGVLNRVSLCTRGEALGHGFWVDGVMLQQIADLANAMQRLKCRFTHPDWCADGTGKYLGRSTGPFVVEGDQVFAKALNFANSAHSAPDGDLAGYTMDLSDEDPAAFGLSIVFRHDWNAEDEFYDANIQDVELSDDSGKVTETRRQFVSPDPLNVDNLPHARILELYAADVVDDPAANPNGMFHRSNPAANEGREVLNFILGRSTEAPKLSALGIVPERMKAFVSQFMATEGLSLQSKEAAMPKPKPATMWDKLKSVLSGMPASGKLATDEKCDDKEDPEQDTASDGKDEKGADGEEDPPKDDKGDPKKDDKSDDGMGAGLAPFVEMFGAEQGAKYFLQPLSFEDALKAEVISLRGQLKTASDKLATFAELGVDPVKFNALPDKSKGSAGEGGGATTQDGQQLSPRDRFTAMNKATQEKPKPDAK